MLSTLVIGVDVLGADEVALEVHHIGDSLIRDDATHPEDVVEGGLVAGVTIVVGVGLGRVEPAVLCHDELRRDDLTAHVRQTSGEVGLLPLLPEAIQVSVV